MRVKVANLSEIGEKKGVLGALVEGQQDADELVADGEVYYRCPIKGYETIIIQQD